MPLFFVQKIHTLLRIRYLTALYDAEFIILEYFLVSVRFALVREKPSPLRRRWRTAPDEVS